MVQSKTSINKKIIKRGIGMYCVKDTGLPSYKDSLLSKGLRELFSEIRGTTLYFSWNIFFYILKWFAF